LALEIVLRFHWIFLKNAIGTSRAKDFLEIGLTARAI
jgi:hypothetical protein